MSQHTVRGSVPQVIRNDAGLYVGDLVHYFKVVFNVAQNTFGPYHNFRHMLHVTVLCHMACEYYRDQLSPRMMRNLLIAALFHDFDHSTMMGNDDLNIARAVRALDKHLLPEDRHCREDIVSLIAATEYPYKVDAKDLPLSGLIIRDADMSQGLSVAWIQQIVFGLAEEWRKTPIEVLKGQEAFLSSLRFHTEWGQAMFPQHIIDEKRAEARELVALLQDEASAAA